jgi:hypothetical protein
MADESQRFWLLVSSKEIYDTTRSLGFELAGIKARYQKKSALIQPGDKALFYITGLKVFGGIVTATSPCFEDKTPIWHCAKDDKPGEDPYLYRFRTKPTLIPASDNDLLPVEPIRNQLQYLKKWPEKNWTLGFQGNLHEWPESDFHWVESHLAKRCPTGIAH